MLGVVAEWMVLLRFRAVLWGRKNFAKTARNAAIMMDSIMIAAFLAVFCPVHFRPMGIVAAQEQDWIEPKPDWIERMSHSPICDWHYADGGTEDVAECAALCRNEPNCRVFTVATYLGCRFSRCGSDPGPDPCPSDFQCPIANWAYSSGYYTMWQCHVTGRSCAGAGREAWYFGTASPQNLHSTGPALGNRSQPRIMSQCAHSIQMSSFSHYDGLGESVPSNTGSGTGCATCVDRILRTTDSDCASCNVGYFLSGTSCQPYPCSTGSWTVCATCVDQAVRTAENHCATCNPGYFLSGTSCQEWYDCSTGSWTACATCVDQAVRTAENHCATCNPGYFLSGTSCQPYPCSTGSGTVCATCVEQAARTANDHCASCNPGYFLGGTSCQDWTEVNSGLCDSHYADLCKISPSSCAPIVAVCADLCRTEPNCRVFSVGWTGCRFSRCGSDPGPDPCPADLQCSLTSTGRDDESVYTMWQCVTGRGFLFRSR